MTGVEDICRLCGKTTALQQSHIIPAFAYRWLKKNSATGFLRGAQSPNVRTQDGYHTALLCDKCEQKIAQWEKTFSEEVFVPLHEGRDTQFPYGPWMLKFASSVSWRVLSHFRDTSIDHLNPSLLEKVDDALHCWSEFLLGRKRHVENFTQHILPLDMISSFQGMEVPPNINRYILCSIEMDVAGSESEAFVWTKMCRIAILGFIHMKHAKHWKDIRLRKGTDHVGRWKTVLPVQLRDFLFDRANRGAEIMRELSDKQVETIAESYRKDLDRAVDSISFSAMDQDVRLFGDAAFKFTQDRRSESD